MCRLCGLGFDLHCHRIHFAFAAHNHPRPRDFGMRLDQCCHLFGAHKHAFDFGGLIGPAHPAFDPHIGAPARALAGQNSA